MKRRRVILLALGLLLAIVAAAFWLGRSPREPEYHGKKLSDWTRIGDPLLVGWDRDAAEQAVRKMGTNALPWLVKWLDDRQRPPWQTKALGTMAKFPKRFGGNYALNTLRSPERWMRFRFACDAFRALGNDARPAIPDLVKLARKPGCQNGGRTATRILISFGDELNPQLIAILRHPEAPGRLPIIDHFHLIGVGPLGTNANAAVEGLVCCLNDNDSYTRSAAASTLGHLMLRPDIAVPALAQACADPAAHVRESALQGLSLFGDAARTARPAIEQALKDPDAGVRAVAEIAVGQISE